MGDKPRQQEDISMKNICVYCGSNPGRQEAYSSAARALAKSLVDRNLGLVYGGASVGIMGLIADTVLQLGGRAVGVIPEALVRKEIAHKNLTELHVTQSMHCLLYTSDAADDLLCVDLGGRR